MLKISLKTLNEGLNIGYGVLESSIYLVVYLQTLLKIEIDSV